MTAVARLRCALRGRWSFAAVLLALVLSVLAGRALANEGAGPSRATREEAARLLAVVAPFGRFNQGDMGAEGYTFLLDDAGGRRLGELHVGFGLPGQILPRVRSLHYTLTLWNNSPDFHASVDVLAHAANAIVDADGGPLPETATAFVTSDDVDPMESATLYAIAVACALSILRRGRLTVDIRKPHIVQACVHTSIFLYWSLYWPGVRVQAPMILLMIVLAYAADASFSLLRYGSWRLGLSPFPIVFSTNLFVWLDWHGAVLAMVGALFCKYYVQRNGRHIFNPSVAGLVLNAICTILFPSFVHFQGLFHTLNIAPDMAEWVFLGSLVPLVMFRLLPVSIGSIIGLYYLTETPGSVRPMLLLMMTLLATDPATTPDTNVGRLIFGIIVGVSYPLYSRLLHALGHPDDFAKNPVRPARELLRAAARHDRAAPHGVVRDGVEGVPGMARPAARGPGARAGAARRAARPGPERVVRPGVGALVRLAAPRREAARLRAVPALELGDAEGGP